MKVNYFAMRWLGIGGLLLWGFAGLSLSAQEEESAARPQIVFVQLDGEELAVEVEVPKGLRRVTLESRTRLERGSWVPRRVQRLDGKGGIIVFRLKREASVEMLRVSGTAEEPLPSSFYEGNKFFPGATSSPQPRLGDDSGNITTGPGIIDFTQTPVPNVVAGAGDGNEASREVEESDIWRMDGDHLYFFNQFRGLQIIDVSDPDSPKVIGTLSLPASGEQMYVMEDGRVVLLVHDACNSLGAGVGSRIVIVDATDNPPSILSILTASGAIMESRLVGTALYTVSQFYAPVEETDAQTFRIAGHWEYRLTVSSWDLAVPESPIHQGEHPISGSAQAVYATESALFIAVWISAEQRSEVEMIDISSPEGLLTPLSRIRIVGSVSHKFNMRLQDDVFTVISQKPVWPTSTWLETFDVSDPLRPRKLGELEVVRNESLHATRFDGDKAYIVTFLRIDPLWIVDLSNPSHPTISGELEVPGWSTYLQPMGDRLLSVGVEDAQGSQVAVSLFDVRNPAEPALLSRLPLGESHSWTEANHNEKALGFFPEAGLVLIPFSASHWVSPEPPITTVEPVENSIPRILSEQKGVQLIELVGDELILRGVIEEDATPRRTTLHKNRILSLSGKSLLTVDASDYDHPKVLNKLRLSWSVDQVIVEGDYLIEFSYGNGGGKEAPAIRVAAQAEPHTILAESVLSQNGPIQKAEIHGNRLYIVQGGSGPEFNVYDFHLLIYDIDNLPSLSLLGKDTFRLDERSLQGTGFIHLGSVGDKIKLHFPFEDVLTISNSKERFYIFFDSTIVFPVIPAVEPHYHQHSETYGHQLVTFNIGQPEEIRLLSDYPIQVEGSNLSEVFAAGSTLYMSSQAWRSYEEGSLFPAVSTSGDLWMQQYFLNVIDFADPENPTERRPVNIPGTLVGIGRGGALLYTQAPHWDEETLQSDGVEWLDVSAYDGVFASLVDSVPLSSHWGNPILVDKDIVYFGSSKDSLYSSPAKAEALYDTNTLTAYRLADAGTFEIVSQTALPGAARELRLSGEILTLRLRTVAHQEETWFYNVSQPGQLAPLGAGSTPNCFGYNLMTAEGSASGSLWAAGGDYGALRISLEDDLNRILAIHWGMFEGKDCADHCAIRMEARPGEIQLFGGISPWRTLSSEDWQKLLGLVNLEEMRRLSATMECPDCGDEGGEWLQVFTPQGAVRAIFPRGPEDGEILSPLAGPLSPLAEKMRGFLPRFHPHWPGWPSQQRAEELRKQEEERRKREEERRKREEEQRRQEEELRRQEEERKRREEERRQAIEKARTEMLVELREELRELEASGDAEKLAKWAEWRKIVKQLLEEPEETEEEREALWRAFITEININLPGKKPPPLPPTLPPLDPAVLKPMPEADLNRVTEVHWGIHWKIAYDDYFTGDCEIRLLANSKSISMDIDNSSEYPERSENFILDFASKALSPEEWQSLLDSVNIETLRKLSATTECPDCEDNGREWVKVFTPQEEVKLSFPIGEKDGKVRLPLAESASPLAEKMREFLPRFAGWPGWPGYWATWLDWLHWISWYPEEDW